MYAFALTILGADGQQCERELAVAGDPLVLPGAARDRVRTWLAGLRQARLRLNDSVPPLPFLKLTLNEPLLEHELRGGFAHVIDCCGAGKDAVCDYVAGSLRSRRAHQLEVLSSRCRRCALTPAGAAMAGATSDQRRRAECDASQRRDSSSHLVLLLIDVAIPPQTGPTRKRSVGGWLAMRSVPDSTAICWGHSLALGATPREN